jgi:hypothetical protein
MCLWTVQEWFGSPHLHPDAWTHAKHVTLISGDPPRGVPVWYGPGTGSRFGHVALSLGGGRIRSTDCPRDGMVDDTDLLYPLRRWGHDYVGWSTSIGGQQIPGLGGGGEDMPLSDEDAQKVAWAVWSFAEGTLAGQSAASRLASLGEQVVSLPGRVWNYRLPVIGGTADAWTLLRAVYDKVTG